jgi:hypothetical protein
LSLYSEKKPPGFQNLLSINLYRYNAAELEMSMKSVYAALLEGKEGRWEKSKAGLYKLNAVSP